MPVIADGGGSSPATWPAIAAGADVVMIGSSCGHRRVAGRADTFQGRSFKTYRGMGSIGAMSAGSATAMRRKPLRANQACSRRYGDACPAKARSPTW
ncbi:MAG: IMP dehydrogenase [Pyrinomonadaceae bacterium]